MIFQFFFLCFYVSNAIHTNNWAIIIETSRFWFNYRHAGNALGIYRSIKRLGIPDSRIILMLADHYACNARNPHPASVFQTTYSPIDLYGDDIEVDYRGYEVTVDNFIRVLTDRLSPSAAASKRMNSDQFSNILIYMTGHGGDGFLKFQDDSELSSEELADTINQLWLRRRYNEILIITDTCQAESMGTKIYSPNVITIGSSRIGEESLSYQLDTSIGVFVTDRYSYYAVQFLENLSPDSNKTMDEFMQICPYHQCLSHVVNRTELFARHPRTVLVTDFFSSIHHIEDGSHFLSEIPNTSPYISKISENKTTFQGSLAKGRFSFLEPIPVEWQT